jgi:hypothetical protein
MHSSRSALMVIGCFVIAAAAFTRLGAQEPKVVPKEEPPKGRIVPVVAIKPGEAKELLMSSPCALFSRSGGLIVREMGESGKKEERTVWKKDGLTVELQSVSEGAEISNAPAYTPLRTKGLSTFIVKVSASKEAKTGLIDFHLASETCSGTCSSDFRVLVIAP